MDPRLLFPPRSFTEELTTTLYVVLEDRRKNGVNNAVRPVASSETVPDMKKVPVHTAMVDVLIVAGSMISLKVINILDVAATPVAPDSGDVVSIVGGILSDGGSGMVVNVQTTSEPNLFLSLSFALWSMVTVYVRL